MTPAFLLLAVAQVAGTLAASFPKLQEALPPRVNISSFYPAFDFEAGVCLPSDAFSSWGNVFTYKRQAELTLGRYCREPTFLGFSNTFHRHACATRGDIRFCGHFFALHMLHNQTFDIVERGANSHQWVTAAVWTRNGVAKYAGHSTKGGMLTLPTAAFPKNNGHIEFVYYSDENGSHALRFANKSEAPTNPYGKFVTPTIASWQVMHCVPAAWNWQLRDFLNRHKYLGSEFSEKDEVFLDRLNRFKPQTFPPFAQEDVDSP